MLFRPQNVPLFWEQYEAKTQQTCSERYSGWQNVAANDIQELNCL
jgi:hypothetical protein